MKIVIDKLPVVILSTPRSGSSVLGAYIEKILNNSARYFLEPDHKGPESIRDFKAYIANNNNFILKTHLTFINRYDAELSKYLTTSDNIFRIRIQRRDVVAQIASFYIAKHRRGKWHFKDVNELNLNDQVEIKEKSLKLDIDFIQQSNKILSSSQINFNLNLFYEELDDIDDLGYYPSPRPSNYLELVEKIKLLL